MRTGLLFGFFLHIVHVNPDVPGLILDCAQASILDPASNRALGDTDFLHSALHRRIALAFRHGFFVAHWLPPEAFASPVDLFIQSVWTFFNEIRFTRENVTKSKIAGGWFPA